VIWWLVYVGLVAVLFVRVQAPDAPSPRPLHPAADEPFALVHWHHRIFYALLVGAPIEAVLRGGASGGRLLGALCFAAGVVAYRVAGRSLGPALSPLVSPRPEATLVTHGPYRWLRHPMYLGQVLIAVGAPLTVGARLVLCLAVPAFVVLTVRAHLEDAALARAFPMDHPQYVDRTKRLLPFLF
jgi:protein-S-isoprenylcysteine O-methyltransferase Ste14